MKKYRKIVLMLAGLFLALPLSAGELKIKSGEKIAFLGDSITELGNHYPCGFLYLVRDGLRRSGVTVHILPAGRSGNQSFHMLDRLDSEVIQLHPDWMTLSCGVNDVWHGSCSPAALEEYKKNITAICDKAQAAGIKIMILTPTMIQEDAENDKNKALIPYNEFLRDLAKRRGYLLADTNAVMQKEVAAERKADKKNVRTYDGVHMLKSGHLMIAEEILKSFGMPAEEAARYRAIWQDYPENTVLHLDFTIEEWRKIEKAAAKQNRGIHEYVNRILFDSVQK